MFSCTHPPCCFDTASTHNSWTRISSIMIAGRSRMFQIFLRRHQEPPYIRSGTFRKVETPESFGAHNLETAHHHSEKHKTNKTQMSVKSF